MEHTLERVQLQDGQEVLRIKIGLPAGACAQDFDVDIDDVHVKISSSVHGECTVPLDQVSTAGMMIDSGGARARFLKKARQLRVDIPLSVETATQSDITGQQTVPEESATERKVDAASVSTAAAVAEKADLERENEAARARTDEAKRADVYARLGKKKLERLKADAKSAKEDASAALAAVAKLKSEADARAAALASSEPEEDEGLFARQALVMISGLTGAKHHNGKSGRVLRHDKKKDRYAVLLETGETIAVKAGCLIEEVFDEQPQAPTLKEEGPDSLQRAKATAESAVRKCGDAAAAVKEFGRSEEQREAREAEPLAAGTAEDQTYLNAIRQLAEVPEEKIAEKAATVREMAREAREARESAGRGAKLAARVAAREAEALERRKMEREAEADAAHKLMAEADAAQAATEAKELELKAERDDHAAAMEAAKEASELELAAKAAAAQRAAEIRMQAEITAEAEGTPAQKTPVETPAAIGEAAGGEAQDAVAAEMAAAASELKRRGNVEFQRGDYRHAAELFGRAAQLEPKNAVHYSNRCLARLKAGGDKQIALAVDDAATVRRLKPGWPKGFYREGVALLAAGRPVEAAEALRAGCALEPGNKAMAKSLAEAEVAAKAEAAAKRSVEEAAAKRRAADERAALRKAAGQSDFERLPDAEAAAYAGWPVTVAVSEVTGRGVIAERALRPGEVAWAGRAWAAVVADNFVGTVCGNCFCVPSVDSVPEGTAPLPFKCEDCGLHQYCSERCRDEASAVHKLECKSAATVVQMSQGKSDTRGARMLINVLAHRKLEQDSQADGAGAGDARGEGGALWTGAAYADVQKLVAHVDKVRKTPSWPRSWANFSPLQLCSHRNAWANLHLLGQPNSFYARRSPTRSWRASAASRKGWRRCRRPQPWAVESLSARLHRHALNHSDGRVYFEHGPMEAGA
jgi:hypothetical protein